MARIRFKGSEEDETTAQGGGGGDFSAAPRGVYMLQVVDHSEGAVTQGGKNPGTPITKLVLEIADDDERGAFGKKVWHNVVWIPRGKGEKPAGGHGIAVHFLHSLSPGVAAPQGDVFDFDESDFQGQEFRALLEVDTYDKEGADGRVYTNEKNVVREIFGPNNPEPSELPPPPGPKRAKAAPAGRAQARQPVAAGAANGAEESEEVPF